MFNKSLKYLAGIAMMFSLASVAVLAQVESGSIAGSVTDQTGALVPGATITLTNTGTNAARSAQSSSNGTYTITGLEPATYQVGVSASGFAAYAAKVEVTVGGRVTLEINLSVSASTSNVEVIAEGGAQVNTQTQELSQVINAEQVSSLPSLTRNPYDFVAISGNISNGDAGSSGSGTGMQSNSQNSTTRGVGFNINGQRSSGTEILLDGVENISVFGDGIGIFVPLDSVQEFRVSTSNFEPQFGRASGGVVNVTTKSGSNRFHGNLWEYNRLSAYTSNTETNDQLGVPKGRYTRNQFGGMVGGPIFKNKLFFFGGAEWIRVRSAAALLAAVPTPEFLALSAPNIQDYFNTYGGGKSFNFTQTYSADEVYGAGNAPPGLPGTTPMLGTVAFTAPQNAGGGVPTNTYNIVARVDYSLSDRTQLFYRYVDYNEIDEAGSQFASPYSQYNVGQSLKNQAHLLNLTHLFSPSLSSNTKLSFSRFDTSFSYDKSLQDVPTLVVSVNATVPGTGTPIQLPGFYDTNPANGGLPFGGPQNTSQINEDLSWLKSRHTMQFGTQLLYIQDNQAYGAYAQANEQLGSNRAKGLVSLYDGSLFEFQAAVDPKGALPCVRNPYTGALTPTAGCSIGLPAVAPSFARSERFKDWAVYAQDSFKVVPKLTLNYGLRYEYYGVQHNNDPNLDSNFYYGPGATLPERERSGQVFTVPNSPIHSLWNPQYGTLSPRVGFAYDVSGNGRESIRGGYGIAYERNFGNVTFNVIQNPPNYAVIIVNNTVVTNSNSGPLAGDSAPASSPCYPAACLPPTSLRHVDQNIRTAQTQFWSLAFEHQLTHSTVLSLQYVGARGVHLYDIKNYNGLGSGNALLGDPVSDPNPGDPLDPDTGEPIQALTRLNPQYSNANNRGSGGDSYYQGANVQFETTNLHHSGLSVVANYTFAHALDDLSTTFSESNNAFSLGYTNPFNPALDHGNGDLDTRHRLVLAPIYAEPFFKNSGFLVRQVLSGWQIAGIYLAHTGSPFTYFDSTNNGTGYNVARYTPASGHLPKTTFKSIPSGITGGGTNTYTIGSLGPANSWGNPNLLGISDWGPWPSTMPARNSFRGPGIWNLDFELSKKFPIREGMNIEFRAESFNIFNHHDLFLLAANNDACCTLDNAGDPLILAAKGGIGNNGGANDERRFGQFALKFNF